MGRGAIGAGKGISVRPMRKDGDIEGRSTVNRWRIAWNGADLLYVLTMAGIFGVAILLLTAVELWGIRLS